MAGPDGEREGFKEGLESSDGHPVVLVLINAVLSVTFAWLLVWGASFVDIVQFSTTNVAAVAIAVFVFTFVMSRP